MANVKITALNTITPAATDVLPVVDVAANVTSKTTVANIPKNASNGTAATPSHSFAGDTDTGMWRKAADTLAFSTGAAQIVELTAAGNLLIGGTLPSSPAIELNATGSAEFTGLLRANSIRPLVQDSAAAPGLCVFNEPDTGFFRPSGNTIGISTNGTERARVTSNGDLFIGLPASPAIKLNANGSSEFEGNLDVGNISLSSTTTSGASLDAVGKITLQRANGSNNTDRIVKTYKGSTETFATQADGTVLIGGDLTNSTNPSPNVELNNNGSSTFQGELTINRPTGQASALVIRENNVEKIKLKPNGQALFSGPVSIGGTAAINTIDVYEEGSITPSVEFGGSATGITYSSRIGKFTRIGDQVTIYVFVALSDKGTSTGNAIIKTLPFTSANIVASNLVGWPGVVAGRQQNFSGLDVNNPNIGITVARNGVGMLLRTVGGVNLTDANFTNGSIIEYQLTYTTN